MLLRGRLAEMMVQVDPSMYRKYVTYLSNGQAMLYVRLSKALYGMQEGIGDTQDRNGPLFLGIYHSCEENAICGNCRRRTVGFIVAVVGALLASISDLPGHRY